MRLIVPVDGSAAANHALAHALSLVMGREDTEVILLNVQSGEMLDVSDISAVMSTDLGQVIMSGNPNNGTGR